MLYWLAVSLVLIAGVSVIWSLEAQLAYLNWVKLAAAAALFSALTIFNFNLRKIAWAWVASSVIQSGFAIWQFFVQYTPANKWLGLAYHLPTIGGSIILETDSERWLRAYGSLPHPNALAGFLLIGLIFAFYLSLTARGSSTRMALAGSLIVMVPAIFFSFSRSAWIALIIVLAALGIWLVRTKRPDWRETFFQLLFIVGLLVVILSSLLFEPLLTRILSQEPLEENSIELRLTFTQQALTLINNDLLTGTGIGNYTWGVYQQINAFWPGYYYQPVHNIYLLILAELGIFGLAILGILLACLGYHLGHRPASLEKTMLMLALVAILIISLFDHYFWTLYSGLLVFWIILGLNFRQLSLAVNQPRA